MAKLFTMEKFKRNFQNFCDGTSMHGFTELYYAKNLFWVLIWLLTIVAAIAASIYQVYGAFYQFIEEKTTANILPATKEDILYPPMKICFPHWLHWVDFEKGYNMNFTKEGILYGLSYLTEIYSEHEINVTEAKNNFFEGMKMNKINTFSKFFIAVSLNSSILTTSDFEGSMEFVLDDFFFPDIQLCHIQTEEDVATAISKKRMVFSKLAAQPWNLKYFKILVKSLAASSNYISKHEYAKYMETWLNESTEDSTAIKDFSTIILPTLIYPNSYDSSNPIILSPKDGRIFVSIKASINKWKSSKNIPCDKVGGQFITNNKTCKDKCIIETFLKKDGLVYVGNSISLKEDTLDANIYKCNFNLVRNETVEIFYDGNARETFNVTQKQSRKLFTGINMFDYKLNNGFYKFINCIENCESTIRECQVYKIGRAHV